MKNEPSQSDILKKSVHYLLSNPHFVKEYAFFKWLPQWIYWIIPPIKTFLLFYTWFRWIDNTIDVPHCDTEYALTFLEARKTVLSDYYITKANTMTKSKDDTKTHIKDTSHGDTLKNMAGNPEDEIAQFMVQIDLKKKLGLRTYIENILKYLKQDILARYSVRSLEQLKTDAIQIKYAFEGMMRIFHIPRTMASKDFDAFIFARETIYNLWDLKTDLELGFIYIPKSILEKEGLTLETCIHSPERVLSNPHIQDWKKEQFQEATHIFEYLLKHVVPNLPLRERLLFRFSIRRTQKKISSDLC